jgi:VanZ family protein
MRDSVCCPGLRWAIWLTALAVYTYLLVVPSEWLPPWMRATVGQKITEEFTSGKLIHAVMYGLLTVTACFLPIAWRGWWLCVACLSLHGFGTEFIQTFTGRSGRWEDVLTDHVGIAAGLVLCGLMYWLGAGRAADRRPERKTTSPEVQQQAGREDRHADPL